MAWFGISDPEVAVPYLWAHLQLARVIRDKAPKPFYTIDNAENDPDLLAPIGWLTDRLYIVLIV